MNEEHLPVLISKDHQNSSLNEQKSQDEEQCAYFAIIHVNKKGEVQLA